MLRRLFLYMNTFVILLVFIGCSADPIKNHNNTPINIKKGELTQVNSVDKFTNINGFKIEDGKFYFSGIKNDKWGFYELNLQDYNIQQRYSQIGEYDVFIPLNGEDAIYINLDGELFIRRNGTDTKIDDEIYGVYSPNILVSSDQKGILYTKGEQENAALYMYMLDQKNPIKIREEVSSDAFFTFSYTTHWSNESHYFIFDNKEIYDNNGKLYDTIDATTAKWAPNDKVIAYIRKPKDLEGQKISIGEWKSHIGNEFALYYIDNKKDETIYESKIGLIDAIDSIQWAKDSSMVGLSVGKINKTPSGQLENIDYEKVYTYSLKNKISKEVNDMPYNFYEILFDKYIYGSSIGKRDKVEIVDVFEYKRKIFDTPVILNSKDMFIISTDNTAYLINGRKLMELRRDGGQEMMIELPWDISEMYWDSKTKQLILINKEYLLFVIKL